jgi:NADPH:quinone reductase-like Zn-dependent oxidoreductase
MFVRIVTSDLELRVIFVLFGSMYETGQGLSATMETCEQGNSPSHQHIMSPQKQKALFLESKQGRFVVGERDVPEPSKGQLLVKIHAAALNPIDYKIQQTGVFVEKFPAVLGVDMAGVVEDVGEGVQDYVTGDKVYVQFYLGSHTPFDHIRSFSHGSYSNDQATYQKYAVVADYTAKVSECNNDITYEVNIPQIPPNLDYDQAATVPLGFDTAAVGLYSDQLGAGLTPPWAGGQGKYAGRPILIMGGSSSVGSYGK